MRPVSYCDRKLYVCGLVLEFVEFELPVVKPSKVSRVGRAGQSFTTDDVKRLNREKTVSRSRQIVCRFINTNFTTSSKFVTLTFAENVTDLRFANRELGKFLKRALSTRKASTLFLKIRTSISSNPRRTRT